MLKRFLSLDFGTKRIGLATNFGSIAEPLNIIANDDQVWSVLQKAIDELQIQALVIGVSENEMAAQARQFGQQLSQKTQLPVEFWDETLTTVEAKNRLAESGKKIDVRNLDHLSAALILQDYLDMKSGTSDQ